MRDANLDAKAIFFEAIDQKSPEELLRYLDEACSDNVEVRSRVEELLRAHQDAGDFLGGSPPADATINHLPITERPGTVIGPYKLLQEIGHGGMGVVYMAEQTEPVERRVALKIIKPGMDTRQVIARFEAERQAVAMMDHPNIAKVLDAGTTDSGHPYFVMELVKGISITEYCDEHRLSPRQRLELFMPVCQAIQHAHQKGIIHRDIKPSNVLVAEYDDRPVPKIIDFGVAKAINQRLTEKTMFTQLGQLVGTFEYMSPEQAKLNQLDIDTRSDIYSLGVLLYELLTGETPFDGRRLRSAAFDELLRIIREEEPPRPSARLSSSDSLPSIAANRRIEPKKLGTLVRGELDWIVMKALEKDRGRRYDSSQNLAADVERFLTNQPVEAHPPSAFYRVRKFVHRYRVPVATALLMLTLITLGGIIATTGWVSSYQKQREKESLLEDVKEESAKRQQLVYIADMDFARQALESGDIQRVEMLLRQYVPRGDQGDLRGFEWFYLWRQWKRGSDPQVVLPSLSRRFWNWLALSSDGSRLAIGCPNGQTTMAMIDMSTHKKMDSFGTGSLPWDGVGLAISTDGKTCVYRGPRQNGEASTGGRQGGTVIVRNVETGVERTIDTISTYSTVALSPDLRTLAIGHRDGTIWLWDLELWKKTATLQSRAGIIYALAFSPDGNNLASASKDRTVRVWNVTTKQSMWEGKGYSGSVLSVAYSPDGKYVATGDLNKLVVIWDAVTGERLQTLGGARDEVRVVTFSHDGMFLAAGCREGAIRVWRLPDFKEHDTIHGFSGLYGLAFLPDGKLLFCDKNHQIVSLKVRETRHGILSTPSLRGTFRRTAFSADGSILAALNDAQSQNIYLWQFTQDGSHELDPLPLSFKARALAISCQNVLAVGDSLSATVHLFDLLTRESRGSLTVPRKISTVCAAFSPTGKRLAIGCGDGSAIVWDLESGQTLMDRLAHEGTVRGVCFSGNDRTLLTGGSDRFAKLWSVEQGNLLRSFGKHPTTVWAVDATNDGNTLAASTFSRDTKVWLYRRTSNKPLGFLRGHQSSVLGIKFFRDGKTLVSAGACRTVRLWDIDKRQQRFVFDGGTCIFECLDVSPDERTLAAGGRDGTIRIYRAASPEEVKAEVGWWRVEERE